MSPTQYVASVDHASAPQAAPAEDELEGAAALALDEAASPREKEAATPVEEPKSREWERVEVATFEEEADLDGAGVTAGEEVAAEEDGTPMDIEAETEMTGEDEEAWPAEEVLVEVLVEDLDVDVADADLEEEDDDDEPPFAMADLMAESKRSLSGKDNKSGQGLIGNDIRTDCKPPKRPKASHHRKTSTCHGYPVRSGQGCRRRRSPNQPPMKRQEHRYTP